MLTQIDITTLVADRREDLGDLGTKMALRILDEHRPETPPEGTVWHSGDAKPHCIRCATGDSFLDVEWPCSAVEAIYDVLMEDW